MCMTKSALLLETYANARTVSAWRFSCRSGPAKIKNEAHHGSKAGANICYNL